MLLIASKPVDEFGLNALNRTNTYQGSERFDFMYKGVKFGLGFWPNYNVLNGPVWPCLALTVWEQSGWRVLKVLYPIVNNDPAMNMGSVETDLDAYMWWIATQFNAPLKAYLMVNGVTVDDPKEFYERVIELLKTVKVNEDDQLQFDGK